MYGARKFIPKNEYDPELKRDKVRSNQGNRKHILYNIKIYDFIVKVNDGKCKQLSEFLQTKGKPLLAHGTLVH